MAEANWLRRPRAWPPQTHQEIRCHDKSSALHGAQHSATSPGPKSTRSVPPCSPGILRAYPPIPCLKSALWPTTYTPRRKDEPEPWTRGKLKWAWDAVKSAVDEALRAQRDDREVRLCIPDVEFPSNVSLSDPRHVRLRSCPSLLIFQNPSTPRTTLY